MSKNFRCMGMKPPQADEAIFNPVLEDIYRKKYEPPDALKLKMLNMSKEEFKIYIKEMRN